MATLNLFDGVTRFMQKASKAASASTSKVLASFTRSRSSSPPKHKEKEPASPKKAVNKKPQLSRREELADLLDQEDSFSSFVAAGRADSAIKPIVNCQAVAAAESPPAKKLTQEAQKSAAMAKHQLMQLQKEAISQRALLLSKLLQQSQSSLATTSVCNDIASHLTEYPQAVEFYSKFNIIPLLLKEVLRCEKGTPATQKQVVAARRCLALMGYAPPAKGPGVRILCLDGGGMKGLALIEVLKHLEKKVGRPLGEVFDYVMGVSTGGVILLLHFLLRLPLQECEELYLDIGRQMFTRGAVIGTSKLLLNQAFYDSELWEKILINRFERNTFSDYAGDIAVPKIGIISAVVTDTYLCPYVFRNYNSPCVLEAQSSIFPLLTGSAKYKLWQACRASSAAPFYYEDFKLDGIVHLDGGHLATNPTAYALHEAALLWPREQTCCIVSVGTGRAAQTWLPTIPSDTSGPNRTIVDIAAQSLNDLAKSPSLRQKILNLVQSATDTEVTHSILAATLPKDKYFRFNPFLSEQVNLDENRLDLLKKLQNDAQQYAELNERKFRAAANVLNRRRPKIRQLYDRAHISLTAQSPMLSTVPLSLGATVNASKEKVKQKSLMICGTAYSKASAKMAPVRKWISAKWNRNVIDGEKVA